jgi:hypothetical protein
MVHKIEAYLVAILILLQRNELQKKFQSRILSQIERYSFGSLSLIRVLIQALNSQSVIQAYEMGELLQSQTRDICEAIELWGVTGSESFSVADIGSGMGGYHKDWLRQYPNGSVFLIDQSKFNYSALLYGHGRANRHYNSLRLAKKYLLSDLGIHPSQINLVDKRFLERVFDRSPIVVSFFSLGFHYPLEIYWEEIWDHSAVEVLILDIRTNSESEIFLDHKLTSGYEARVVSNHKRSTRYRITKKIE